MKIAFFALGFAAALFLCAFLNWSIRQQSKHGKKRTKGARKKKNPAEKLQATKIIVFSILITYHAAFAVGVWAVIGKDINHLPTLLTFVGSVSVFAVAFYCWKSKAENLLKIKQGNPDLQGSLSDFSAMGSQ